MTNAIYTENVTGSFAAMQRFFNYNFYLFWWLTALVIGIMLLYVGGFFGSLWNRYFLR